MDYSELETKIVETVYKYRQMELRQAGASMLREVQWQYADMAAGGDGGSLGYTPDGWTQGKYPTCREYNYPGMPDIFFQEVRDLLGWK